MKEGLKSKLKDIIFSVIAIGLTFYAVPKITAKENYREGNEKYNKSSWKHYFKVETSMFLTQRGFSSMEGAVEGIKESECFWKYNPFTGGVTLSDITSSENGKKDGVVDEIVIRPRFEGKRTTLTRTKDYKDNQQLFENANKQFAKARKPYIARMEKLLAN